MTIENARKALPLYATNDYRKDCFPYVSERRIERSILMEKLWKKYGLALIVFGFWVGSLVLGCVVTGTIVKHNTIAEVSGQYEAAYAAQIQAYKDQEAASRVLTGDESMNAAINALTDALAVHIAGLRMDRGVTADGAKTYIWGVDIARLDSGKYGSSIESVLAGNIECYSAGHAVRAEDKQIAFEIADAYLRGIRPDKWIPSLEFAEIHADGSVTARNELFTGRSTKYWVYGE